MVISSNKFQNMIKLFLCSVFFSTNVFTVDAQIQKNEKVSNLAEVGFGFGNSQNSISGSYIHDWHLGNKGKFYIGTGLRFTSYFGSDINYLSAPASLAKDELSTDTLFAASPSFNAANLIIDLGYHFSSKFSAGFNIDAIGFSFGKSINATYINNGIISNVNAKPTGFNLLLGGNNDKGTLNSHFYLQYLVAKQWGVKAAYQYLFTEYTTDSQIQTVPEANDRFRNKASMAFIGVTYKF